MDPIAGAVSKKKGEPVMLNKSQMSRGGVMVEGMGFSIGYL